MARYLIFEATRATTARIGSEEAKKKKKMKSPVIFQKFFAPYVGLELQNTSISPSYSIFCKISLGKSHSLAFFFLSMHEKGSGAVCFVALGDSGRNVHIGKKD